MTCSSVSQDKHNHPHPWQTIAGFERRCFRVPNASTIAGSCVRGIDHVTGRPPTRFDLLTQGADRPFSRRLILAIAGATDDTTQNASAERRRVYWTGSQAGGRTKIRIPPHIVRRRPSRFKVPPDANRDVPSAAAAGLLVIGAALPANRQVHSRALTPETK